MTHRDRAGDPPGSREAAGPAGHRQGFPTPPRAPAAGSPARPERRLPKAFGEHARGAAMRGIASHAPHLKAMRSPKAFGNRRSGRAGEPAAGAPGGVGKP